MEQALGVSGRGGARLTFRASPGVAKALSHVAVEHIRGAFVSSVNFHGNKSYAGRCVCLERKHADPESDRLREVFLVAATRADANKWVAKVRALVAERNPIDTDDAIRLSPVAAPPTPALVNERDPRRAPASASSSASRRRRQARVVVVFRRTSAPPFEKTSSCRTLPVRRSRRRRTRRRATRTRLPRVSRPSRRARGRRRARTARATRRFPPRGGSISQRVVRRRLFRRGHLARSSAENSKLDAEELQATASATHAQMAQVQEMAREAREAKDAELRATRESVADGARARRGGGGAAPRRRHADAARGESRRGGIPAPRAGGRQGGGRARGGAGTRAPRARGRARAYTKRAPGRRGGARRRACRGARDAAEAAGTQAADALRADLHAAGVPGAARGDRG